MGKYMFAGSYSSEGVSGLLSEGAASRKGSLEALVSGLGGTIESMHWAFGEDDAIVIADLPDDETAAAIGLRIAASGVVSVRTVKLLTADEVDAAIGKNVDFRPPGG